MLLSVGWKDEQVITSERSSRLSGLRSTILNAFFGYSKFHRFILKSSLEMKFSQSEDLEIEFI